MSTRLKQFTIIFFLTMSLHFQTHAYGYDSIIAEIGGFFTLALAPVLATVDCWRISQILYEIEEKTCATPQEEIERQNLSKQLWLAQITSRIGASTCCLEWLLLLISLKARNSYISIINLAPSFISTIATTSAHESVNKICLNNNCNTTHAFDFYRWWWIGLKSALFVINMVVMLCL